MLIGRTLAKRHSSICALCQHRVSLQQSRLRTRRLLSGTTPRANDNNSNRPNLFRPFPAAGASWGISNTSASPQAPNSPSTSPGPPSPYGLNRFQNGQSSTPPSGAPVNGPPTFQRRTTDSTILDPHEAKARARILAQEAEKRVQPTLQKTVHGGVDPQVKARYVWDSQRQQNIERYIKAQSVNSNGDPRTSREQSPSSGLPFSSRNDIQPDFRNRYKTTPLIRYLKTNDSTIDPEAAPDKSTSTASTPIFQETRSTDSQQDHLQNSPSRLGNGQHPENTSKSEEPASSSLWSLAGFSEPGAKKTIGFPFAVKSPLTPSLKSPGDLTAQNSEDGSDKQNSEKWREWSQLARKPTIQKNLESDFWNALHSNVRKSQPGITRNQGTERESPDPPAISNTNETPVPENDPWKSPGMSVTGPGPQHAQNQNTEREPPDPWTVSNEPQHAESQNTERDSPDSGPDPSAVSNTKKATVSDSFDQSREFFDRGERAAKKRGGKSSRRSSRFVDEDDGQDHYYKHQEKRRRKEERKAQREAERVEPIPIILPELINITTLAQALKVRPEDFLVQLEELGFEGVTLDSVMAGETAALVAQEYGFEPTVDAGDSQDLRPRPPAEDPSMLPSRPPVVTIMGHVDHGKTTILDYLRKSSVAAREHGGITQHIGAFSVKLSSGKPITFLDTPGHAAFLTMRQRGAIVTDIVVLVVAADDGVMPQTLEAVKHARAARVPIIVAINKIDKDGARIDAVKNDLAHAGIEIEDFGGDVQVVLVSGKTGQGMDDLEENILTLSEILDHRAELDGPAEGWVLESSLKLSGKVATVLVKRGTLRPGDYIAAGLTWAKIRQLRNEAGMAIAEAPPGTPVEIIGWKDLPAAGDQVIQAPNEDRAKVAVSYRVSVQGREKAAAEYEVIAEARRELQERRALEKAEKAEKTDKTENTPLTSRTGVQDNLPQEENGTKLINFVVKGDVHGSVEAVCAAVQEIGNHEVRPRVLRSATGPITENDVAHAAISKSTIINFATTTPGHIARMAEAQGVRILEHNVIYHLIDEVKANLSELLAPAVTTRALGEAEVLQIFPIHIRGRVYQNIAGCKVRTGIIAKNSLYRVRRRGEVIFSGKLETLKHGKEDVMEMRRGSDCGIGIEGFQDFAIGDEIQAYEEISTARTLE